MPYFAQSFALSCGLSCVWNLLGKSDRQILQENSDILSEEILNFVWLYRSDIAFVLSRYGLKYTWKKYNPWYEKFLKIPWTIAYIPAVNHYLLYTENHFWVDSYRNFTGVPEVWFWDKIPFEPGYIIYRTK